MDLKARNDAQLFYAKLGMYAERSTLGFLVIGIMTVVTYFLGFHGLWLTLIAFGIAIVSFGVKQFAGASYKTLHEGYGKK